MNIFTVDSDPYIAASYLHDKHILKMPLETSQMLSTCHHFKHSNPHQFVRTRQGSYAQQSQRTVKMEGFGYSIPDRVKNNKDALAIYKQAMSSINTYYQQLLDSGMPAEDARGVLPTNIHTNIVAKFNLRTLHEMAKSRLSPRAQGEYQEVFKQMVNCVVNVHPWAKPFLTPTEWAAPSMAKPLNK